MRRIAPCAAALLGLVLLYHPTLASGFRLMQNDLGDTRLVVYILEHSFRWITGDPAHASFWSPPVFFPAKNTAAYTEILLGSAPLYWMFRLLDFLPDTSFQLWTMVLSLMNFAAARLFLRRGLRSSSLPATVGAFLFAFAAPRGAQASHPQLLPQFYSMLALYLLARLFQEPRKAKAKLWISGIAAAFVLQILSCVYLGWFLAFGLLLCLCTALLLKDTRARTLEVLLVNRVAWILSVAIAGLLLLPVAMHYFEAAHEIGFHDAGPPRVQSWLYLGSGTWLYGWQDRIKAFAMLSFEQRMGIGWATLAMVVLGLKNCWRKPWARVIALAAIALIACTSELVPGLSAWRILYFVLPGAKAIRALARVSLLSLIPASIGITAFFERPRKLLPSAALATLLVVEQFQPAFSYDKLEARERVSRVVSSVPKECASYYSVGTSDLPSYVNQVDAILASLDLNIPTLNGYSGGSPPGWKPLLDNVIRVPADRVRLEAAAKSWLSSHGPGTFCLIPGNG